MTNKNEYFELNANKIYLVDSNEVVESRDTVLWNLAKTKFICKTREGIVASGVMNPATALTQEEAVSKSRSNEYTVD
jgi:hypothetical protein